MGSVEKSDGSSRQSNWKRGNYINSGACGKVYEVEDSFLHRSLAVKQVSGCQQGSEKEKAALLKELKILRGLRHPRIVQLYGFCEADGVLSLFMERIKGGSLDNYLKDESKQPLHTSSIRTILRQMLEGVSYLHSKRILHRDIKSGNILMDEHLQIKLADFGVSKVFQEISKATTKPIGTTRWMAPEMFLQTNYYSYEVDIWAIGCTVIEMLTRKRPFHNLNEEHQVLFKLITTDPSPSYDLPETCSQNLRDFLNKVFQKDGSKRPRARDLLLSNPFVTEDDIDETQMKRVRVNDSEDSEGPVSIDGQAVNIDGQSIALLSQDFNDEQLNISVGGLSTVEPQLASAVKQMPLSQQRTAKVSDHYAVNFGIVNHSNKLTNTVLIVQEKEFTARGKSKKLRPQDEEIIKRNWEWLIEELDATHVIRELISYGVFDVDDKREILEPTSGKKRTEIMLKKLLNAGPGPAFGQFLNVLEIDHQHIMDRLRE